MPSSDNTRQKDEPNLGECLKGFADRLIYWSFCIVVEDEEAAVLDELESFLESSECLPAEEVVFLVKVLAERIDSVSMDELPSSALRFLSIVNKLYQYTDTSSLDPSDSGLSELEAAVGEGACYRVSKDPEGALAMLHALQQAHLTADPGWGRFMYELKQYSLPSRSALLQTDSVSTESG